MTPEQKVQTKIIEYLKSLRDAGMPIFYEKRQAGGFSYKKGIPDIYGCYAGLHFEVEVKRPGGVQSALQEKFEQIMKHAGAKYAVVSNINDFKVWFAQELMK